MKLNGRDFPIYATDTFETVKIRIAATLNTCPELLSFPDGFTNIDDRTGNVRVINYLPEIYSSSSLDFPLRDESIQNLTFAQEIFVATNQALASISTNHQRLLLASMKLNIDAEKTFSERAAIIASLNAKLEAIQRESRQFETTSSEFERIPPVQFTTHELELCQFTVNYGPTKLILVELFNDLKLTKKNPFAMMGLQNGEKINYLFKLYRNFLPQDKWIELEPVNAILLKYNNSLKEGKKEGKFTNVAISVINGILYATYNIFIGLKFSSKESAIETIENLFVSHLLKDPIDVQDLNIVSFCIFPNQCIEIPIYSELVMNDETFNAMVAIDEFTLSSKTKQNVYLHLLNSNETISLTMKSTTKLNQYGMKNIGDLFIKCRMKTLTESNILPLQEIIGKLFTLYNLKKQVVIDEYLNFIPSFLTDLVGCQKNKRAKQKGLRLEAPEIFVPKYSRKCTYRPTIISDQEAQTTTKQVMKFPIKGETHTRNFVCPTQNHPFVGLRVNDLENKELFPLIPCCFSKDQTNRAGSLYRQYFFDEEKLVKSQHIQEIYATRKILPPDVTGNLPENLVKLFSVIDLDPTAYYVRKGVNKTPLSAIEAILIAQGQIQYPIHTGTRIVQSAENTENVLIIQRLEKERQLLISEKYAMSAKQELYDENISSIMDRIKNQDLRPTFFVRLLELAYDCNIFVFSADENGQLEIPRHTKAYYKYRPNRKTILLYQHYGTDPDEVEYPQTELIMKTFRNSTNQILLFSPSDIMISNLFKIFQQQSQCYLLGVPLKQIQMRKIPIVSQAVDVFGKCRMINVQHGEIILTIVTDPIPPFCAEALKKIHRASVFDVQNWLNQWNFKAIHQKIDAQNFVREIKIYMGIHAVILVHDSNGLENVPSDFSDEDYKFIESENVLDIFNRNKKLATILFAYALYLFSSFVDKFNLNLSDENLINFIEKNVSVDPQHAYDLNNIKPIFETSSPVLKNGKLILPSQEALNRIAFMIQLFKKNHPGELIDYCHKTNISHFYENISDYISYQDQYILNGKHAVENVLSTANHELIATEELRVETNRPFFFKNPILGPFIYLAQNMTSLIAAIVVCNFWNENHYNIGVEPEVVQQLVLAANLYNFNPTIYSYINSDEINVIKRGDENLSILAYKITNINRFTALMKI